MGTASRLSQRDICRLLRRWLQARGRSEWYVHLYLVGLKPDLDTAVWQRELVVGCLFLGRFQARGDGQAWADLHLGQLRGKLGLASALTVAELEFRRLICRWTETRCRGS